MGAVVVYESMFGNTHTIAERIGDGIRTVMEATVVAVGDATGEVVGGAELLVVGGPTHVHGMSSARSRSGAVERAETEDDLDLDPDAEGPGLRDWFQQLADGDGRPAAAFDTRVHATSLMTGQASKGIGKRLKSHGYHLIVERESFFVDTTEHLEDGEAERAQAWGRAVAQAAAARR